MDSVALKVKVFLQGAYSSSTGVMADTLRTLSLVPTNQPYSSLSYRYTGTEVASSTVLGVSGNDAIVDWVLVELRDFTQPKTVIKTIAGLVQKDGDVVDAATGSDVLRMSGVPTAGYYVAVRHRNHMGIMTNAGVGLSATPKLVDFTDANVLTYGSNARLVAGSKALMWAGNANDYANNSYAIIAQGPDNDTSSILGNVLLASGNTTASTNYRLNGYRISDLTMDGVAIFAGPSNDVNLLLGNVLMHPGNSTNSANFVINEQLPK
jgi:hypothetical protein